MSAVRVHFDDELLTRATVIITPGWFRRLLGATPREFTAIRSVSLGGACGWWDDQNRRAVTDERILAAIERERSAADRRQVDHAQSARRRELDGRWPYVN